MEPARRAVEEAFRAAGGSWERTQEAVERAARASGGELLVLDPDGKPAARSPGLAGAAIARTAPDTLRIDWSGPAGGWRARPSSPVWARSS